MDNEEGITTVSRKLVQHGSLTMTSRLVLIQVSVASSVNVMRSGDTLVSSILPLEAAKKRISTTLQ